MTTKELIKLLQEADPEGNSHVRSRGDGVPYRVDVLEGCWDGPYEYLTGPLCDKNTKFVFTDKGSIVEISTVDIEEWIWNDNKNASRIEFDFENKNKEFLKSLKQQVEESYRKYTSCVRSLRNESLRTVLEFLQDGFHIFQSVEEKIGMYNVMFMLKENKVGGFSLESKKGLNQGQCSAVLETGLFKPQIIGDKIEWCFTLGGDGFKVKEE